MDLSTLRTTVRELTGVNMTELVSDASLNRYINAAYKEFLRATGPRSPWPFLRINGTFNTVIGTGEYNLSGLTITGSLTMRDVTEVRITTTASRDVLRKRRSYDLDEWYDQTTDVPREYAMTDHDSLRLWPIPNAVYAMRVDGIRNVADLSANGDTPLFDSEYHEGLAYLAAIKVLVKEGDDSGRSEGYNDEVLSTVRDMRLHYLGDYDGGVLVLGGRHVPRSRRPLDDRMGY